MTTDDKRWKKLNQLLAKALEQPALERDAWIDEQCGDDKALAAELRELLAFDGEETGGLSDAIVKASARATDPLIGASIGSYRVTDKIAEGGMGVVYAGDREGADFEQRVAIKVMHSHKLDDVAKARFVAERQILASLNHPNIAKLIDGGVTDDGLPFFVMEYIEGENIADYCAKNALSNGEILKLIMTVCDALQYAHNQLVIHRDIKPSNILIDASGAPRLLDFGIAKLLPTDGTAGQQTRPEWRALTPLYASPEQIGNQPISTAADVYGIGLLLYRLLTGRLPYSPTSDHPRDVENAILSSPAELPSSAVTSADNAQWSSKQRKALRGDLDTILLKALRKEPDRRYPTIDAFRDDIKRYLAQLPIGARRDTFAYRMSRFIARNRVAVGLTTVFVVAAVSLTVFYTARLNTERDVAEQTAEFLTGLFEDADPYRRSRDELTVAELVSTGAETVSEDTSLSAVVRARLLVTIGRVLRNVSQIDKAEPLLQEAIAIHQTINAPGDHSRALDVLSGVRLSQGRYAEGIEIINEAIEIAESAFGRPSQEVGELICSLAYLNYRNGDYEKMYEQAETAREMYEAMFDEKDLRLTRPYGLLGTYYQITGNARLSMEYDKRKLEIQEANFGPDDLRLAITLQSIGIDHIDIGDYETAIANLSRAVKIREVASDGTDFQLPQTMYSLAHALGKIGRFTEAHAMFLRLIDLQIQWKGEVHDVLAYWLNGHGDLLANLGATDQADVAFSKATAIYTEINKPEGHFDRSVTLVGHGKVSRDRGDLDAAESQMRAGLVIREKTIGVENTFTQLARIDLADVLRRQGKLDEARSEFEQALSVMRATGNGEHPTAAQALTGLA
ncbi:MAG: serine/threonine-protein kinase, partial [Pseudomonadota bacterium]